MKNGLILAAISCGLIAATAIGSTDRLRLYAVKPDFHDYTLMAVTSDGPDGPVFAINERNGRTHFAREGDSIGEMTVAATEFRVLSVYDPTIGARKSMKEASLVLRCGDGLEIGLTLGKPSPRDGLRATFVDLETCRTWEARAGDDVTVNGETMSIVAVAADGMTVKFAGAGLSIPLVSADERSFLATMWAQRRQERREQQRLARMELERKQREETERREAQARQLARIAAARRAEKRVQNIEVSMTGVPRYFFGTEYRYPVEWRVLPVGYDGQSPRYVAFPTRFRSYMAGSGISITTQ